MKTKTKILAKILLGTVFLSLVLFNFSYAQASYSAGTLVSMTNSARSRNGLGSLSVNSQLTSAAYAKAQDMLANQYFAHTSPSGRTPWDFIKGAGYNYSYAGENLAIGYADASELFSAWMASATHRENILNPNFREIGIAVISGIYEGVETIIVAQEFGAPFEGGEVAAEQVAPAAEQVAPAAEGENETASPASTPEASSEPVAFVREKSSFSPQTVFAGEEVIFEVTITGDVQTLEVQIFEEKINLLETGGIKSNDGQKTYRVSQKIEKEGSSEVRIVAKDKSGKTENLILGRLTVKKTVLTKDTSQQATGLFAGFKNSLKDHWVIYTIVAGGLVLTVAGIIVFRKTKLGKIPKIGLSNWEF